MSPQKILLFSLVTAITLGDAGAVTIGIETFATDGLIAGQTGGTGFNYDNFDGAITTTTSDWDNVSGTPSVVGGVLFTNNSSAKREFNGNIEGAGSAANDGQDDHERSGAIRGVGVVYFGFNLTRSASAVWSGASSYDFGAERLFFGVPSANAATDTIGVQISGGATASGAINLVDGQTYRLVGVVDFTSDRIGLFLNPDGSDVWNAAGGTADAHLAYTGTNWSTALRFGSGGEASWDNLIVATTLGEAVPEPTASVLFLAGAGLLLRRRRR